MKDIVMKYGNGEVRFDIENAKSIEVLEPLAIPAIENLKEFLYKEVEENTIDSKPLSALVEASDEITIVISDLTRLWSRQDLVCKALVEFLNEKCGVAYDKIVVVVALGTHRAQTEDENRKTVSDWVYDRVKVLSHDCHAECTYVGTTSYGTSVHVNPLAVGRKVIIISSTVHHLMSGYGGSRKSILPGISSEETILTNHLMTLHKTEERSSDLVGIGLLDTNPVNNDMNEATAFVNPLFGINIVANKDGRQSHLLCGNWLKAWEKSCEVVNDNFGVHIKEKADIVIASCGGYPKDINLYQGVKTLFNMSEAIKEGGTMVFIGECIEGGGAPAFFDWSKSLKTNTLDKDLRAGFTIEGYVFYAACERIKRGELLALTALPADVLADMKIQGFSSIDDLINSIDFKGKSVYLMPFGGSTVPLIK